MMSRREKKEGDDAEDDIDDDLLSEALGDEEFGLPDLVPGGMVFVRSSMPDPKIVRL